eukprot:1455884-Pleurochrysis_carterae.AAC.1
MEVAIHQHHEPIWDRGQSSYDDVNAELLHIRRYSLHSKSTVDFIGCDGLRHSRLIHKLFHYPTQFLKTAPVVIHQLVRADPNASAFNEHEHFLRILSAGFSQWVLGIIAAGGPGYLSAPPLMRACEVNLSRACNLYFLHDYVFLFRSVPDSVRCNASEALHLCWRDFLALGRTTDSKKKQYCQMAVERVYWGRTAIVGRSD